jgi:hypothetical protein
MIRDLRNCGAASIKVAAAVCCLGATLLVTACGTPVPLDYPAFNLTNSPDTDRPGERP